MSLLILDCPHYCISTASVLHQYCISTASVLHQYCIITAITIPTYQHCNMTTYWYTTDTLLIHYWYTTDTLLIHYWYTTGTLLSHYWHQYCSSTDTVLPPVLKQYWTTSLAIDILNFFFGTHFLCLHLRQIMCNFWIFVFWPIFSLWQGGGKLPPPIPPPPWAKCRLPRGKACTFAQGGGGMGGGSFLVWGRTCTGPCPFFSLWCECFGLCFLGLL